MTTSMINMSVLEQFYHFLFRVYLGVTVELYQRPVTSEWSKAD